MHTLRQLAEYVGGSVVGDADLAITGIQPFETAGPGDLTLASEPRYLRDLSRTRAQAVLVKRGTTIAGKTLLQVDQPKVAFARLLSLLHSRPFKATGISSLASIGKNCRIASEISIHPFACIGDGVALGDRVTVSPGVCIGDNCRIGEDCFLHPNVTIYPGVSLGRRVIVHAGAVLGADGFGYVFDGQSQIKMEQTGTVTIGDDVEIGANSCVDRATFGETVLERGVKLDNHVHIGHNCHIGENTVLVAQVGISGSVQIGRNCVFAGHSGVVDHVRIGDNVTVMMKSAVSKDVPSGSVISGQPAIDHRRSLQIQALTRRLPDLLKSIRRRSEAPGGK